MDNWAISSKAITRLLMLATLLAVQVSEVQALDPILDVLQNLDPFMWVQKIYNYALTTVQGVLTAILMVIALIVLTVYRRRVIYALTGDEFLHADWADSLYFAFGRCCGSCDGEWTRYISKYCCCCFSRLHGANLNKEFWREVGILPKSVVLRGMVVGDLPVSSSQGSYYVQIECGENPPLVSDVVEDVSPEQVSFNQEFVVRMRDQRLGPRLYIIVKDLNIFGSATIARVKIPARKVFSTFIKRDREFNRVRIMLEPETADADGMTMPWVSFEVGLQPEHRHHKYTVHWSKTRISDQPGGTTVRQTTRTAQTGLLTTCGGADLADEDEEVYKLRDFKERFQLHDVNGQPIRENEDKTADKELDQCVANCCACMCFLFVMLMLFATVFVRLWLLGCWTSYTHLARVQAWVDDVGPNGTSGFMLENATFPLPKHAYKAAHAYDVTDEDVLEMCTAPPTKNEPVAFNQFSHEHLGGYSFGCPSSETAEPNVCEWRQKFVQWRWFIWGPLAMLTCFVCWLTNCKDSRHDKDPELDHVYDHLSMQEVGSAVARAPPPPAATGS
mmetsp:Transcript_54198/g.129114  ORF Transcript_54198/g.129114 Transcript_54198/m.129114 type:complete len:559 (+) Transcript_54198:111-1787(+)